MRIAIVHPKAASAQAWQEAMRSRIPDATVTVWPARSDGPADYAIGWHPPPEFFEEERALKAFFVAGAGVDRLLENPAVPPSLPIVRLEDAGMAAQMADYCVREVDHWAAGRRLPVGVFGLGAMGLVAAQALGSRGYLVRGYTRAARSVEGIPCYADAGGAGDLHAFLRAIRVLILVAPLTPETRDRFDLAALGLLPTGSYLINVARGELLVDEALLTLVESGHLAGATLDVFREEPLPSAHPFHQHPNIRVTPHIAAVTLVPEGADQVARKLFALEAGRSVTGVADRTRGY